MKKSILGGCAALALLVGTTLAYASSQPPAQLTMSRVDGAAFIANQAVDICAADAACVSAHVIAAASLPDRMSGEALAKELTELHRLGVVSTSTSGGLG